uniref:hypothetical protein n=1 Tax=Clostridium sp. MCF-1 TaxID=48257 RepID=UPI0018678B88|nr:hypothetical protein [Clostridium sp. MCF-1]
MDFKNMEMFKQYVEGFMQYHNLRGIELLRPYPDNSLMVRACGKGMVHPEGTVLEGVELWESINDILKDDDKKPNPEYDNKFR